MLPLRQRGRALIGFRGLYNDIAKYSNKLGAPRDQTPR